MFLKPHHGEVNCLLQKVQYKENLFLILNAQITKIKMQNIKKVLQNQGFTKSLSRTERLRLVTNMQMSWEVVYFYFGISGDDWVA